MSDPHSSPVNMPHTLFPNLLKEGPRELPFEKKIAMASQTTITIEILFSMESYAEIGEMSRAGLPHSVSVLNLSIAVLSASIIDLYSFLVKVPVKSPPCRIGNKATRSSSASSWRQ